MKFGHSLTTFTIAAGMLAAMVACDKKPTSTATSGIATVVCDASFENILSQEIDVFEYIYPNASIMPFYTDEHAAIDSLLDFKTKTIIVTRHLTQKEIDYFKSHKKTVRQSQIAVDALALIVNPENPVNVLSIKEIREILTGEVKEWNQVEPCKLGKIDVVFDHQGSSTVQYMRDSIMQGQPFADNVYAQNSPQGVIEAVAANKNAVGIIGVSWISSDLRTREMPREERAAAIERNDTTDITFDTKVKVLKVRGKDEVTAYKPYQYYIFDGSYPLFRQIYMITTAPGGSVAHGFYSFVTGFKGQKIIQMTGILPKTVTPRMVSVN